MENWRNLWFLKPRLFATQTETMNITDNEHQVPSRVRVLPESREVRKQAKVGNTPVVGPEETINLSEQVVGVVTVGNIKSVVETSRLFEFSDHSI